MTDHSKHNEKVCNSKNLKMNLQVVPEESPSPSPAKNERKARKSIMRMSTF